MARQVMAQLIAHGKVSRGQLGIRIQDLTPELIAALKIDVQEGSLIADVTPESPADRAGLEIADVITCVNGERIRNSAELTNMIALLSVGSKVVIDVLRKGRAMQATASLEIGRASCRERVGQYVWIAVVADTLKKKIREQ